MPPTPSHGLTSLRSRQGSPGVPSPTPQDDEPLTMAFGIQQSGNKFLLHMPDEIIANVLIEWAMLEWFAPAIARRICRRLKGITDYTPRVWSKLFPQRCWPGIADQVRTWSRRAKAVPKELRLETEDVHVASAALEGAKDATSLIYRIPVSCHIPGELTLPTHTIMHMMLLEHIHEDLMLLEHIEDDPMFPAIIQEELMLPTHMPQLRHLHISISNNNLALSLCNIFRDYNSAHDAHFPCLTVLHLAYVDLYNFRMTPGLFPAIRRLGLRRVGGPILDLIQVCSESLEDLRVSKIFSFNLESLPRKRILLPKLDVLIVSDTPGIVTILEAPALRLICADLCEITGGTRPFSSVVEWATRWYDCSFQPPDITGHLINMPQLQHLMLYHHIETLDLCFESLRTNPTICPSLQSIEVVEVANTYPTDINLSTDFKKSLKACVARRAENVPGFTLQFVKGHVQAARLEQYHTIGVCLFIVMRYYLSYHASRNPLPRSKVQ
jgi:hypothetical protein